MTDDLITAALHSDPPLGALVVALRDAPERAVTARRFLDAARARSRPRHDAGAGGLEVVALWTGLVDHLVCALFEAVVREHALPSPGGLALVALGGYGRAELSPRSDLDLLVLHRGDPAVGGVVEGLLYPLWDAGVDVQGVARTVDENLAVARQDIRSRTSLLEARLLSGDPAVFGELDETVISGEILGGDPAPFIRAKRGEMAARRHRYGDTVYLLEPHLKEGEGGLRDVQTALWISQVRYRLRSPGELVRRGVVPAREIHALEDATDFLLRVRNHLHFLTGRREDRLTYELQDEIAPAMGYGGGDGVPGVEQFLQAYYASANRVRHFSSAVIRRACAGLGGGPPPGRTRVGPGLWIEGDEVNLDPAVVAERPRTLLAAFEAAQDHDAELSPGALEVVRSNLDRVDERFRRDPEAVAAFFRILRHPRRVATTLMAMHDVGFLNRFIPEFAAIHCRAQRDLYHVYPVDVHSLFTVQELRRLARGEYADAFPLLTDLIREVERPDILYLAALLHDVGKGHGGGHAERGAETALVVADRMDLPPGDREYLQFLVRNHLILSHTAQGRDLHDEDLIADFARRVGDVESLRLLYLLTVADIRAVGPGAWSGWKGLLFQELYEKTRLCLEAGPPDPRRGERRAAEVADRIRAAARGRFPPGEVERFLAGVEHARYLLANPVEALVRHLAAYCRRTDGDPVVDRREVPEQAYDEILLVTRDRPGLFAQVAGLLAAHRMNVLSAVLNTRTDGWVVDVFHVSREPGDDPGGRRWDAWKADLRELLSGSASPADLIEARLRRAGGLARPRPRVPVRVEIDNRASGRFTVVDLRTADRIGLLYDVARALAGQRLTIRLAKIATNIEQVADAFYVETLEGGKVEHPDEIERLRLAVERAVTPDGEGGR